VLFRVAGVNDGDAIRDVTAAELPFAIGFDEGGELALGSRAEARPWAWLGQADGALFIQADAHQQGVKQNRQAVSASAWLTIGDEIELGERVIDVRSERGLPVLSVRAASRGPQLTPPATMQSASEDERETLPQAGDGAAALAVQLTTDSASRAGLDGEQGSAARRTASTPGPAAASALERTTDAVSAAHPDPLLPTTPVPNRARLRRRRLAALLLLGLLALGVLLTLLARPLEIVVDPVPDSLSISGLIAPVKFSKRYLAVPGSYRLHAKKSGYHDLDRGFSIELDGESALSFKMEKLPGRLHLTTHPVAEAAVLIDATPVGQAPLQDLELKAGRHAIKVVAERYLAAELAIDIEGMGRSQRVDVELTPGWGWARIDSEPSGVPVMLDGKLAGHTPVMLEPMAGTYRLELHQQGWESVSRELQIEPNRATELAP
jgi:hypothetical protein